MSAPTFAAPAAVMVAIRVPYDEVPDLDPEVGRVLQTLARLWKEAND